ncbi:translation initiation factor 2 [Longispora sp. NPDC051575]|uniref:translation initiation factor 2 n=1 Tax=Longispora sp. NPDC051575 TaxID=3154943 RepID=UPI003423F44D
MTDDYWRRPASGQPEPPAPPARPTPPAYTGPPPSTPPPPGWRPPTIVEIPPARQLPAQEHRVLDAEERAARTITYGVGMMAGAVALVLVLILCGRTLFV